MGSACRGRPRAAHPRPFASRRSSPAWSARWTGTATTVSSVPAGRPVARTLLRPFQHVTHYSHIVYVCILDILRTLLGLLPVVRSIQRNRRTRTRPGTLIRRFPNPKLPFRIEVGRSAAPAGRAEESTTTPCPAESCPAEVAAPAGRADESTTTPCPAESCPADVAAPAGRAEESTTTPCPVPS